MKSDLKAVVFDLDGTLLDTREGIYESARFAIAHLGLPALSEDELRKFVGPPIQKSLVDYAGLEESRAQEGANVFRDYYKETALFKACLYDGVVEALRKIKEAGFKLGVATYKREDYAVRLLCHFGLDGYFSAMRGADNFNMMTKADIIKSALSSLGVEPTQSLYLGDTEGDAKASASLGIPFLAVNWGFGFPDVLGCNTSTYIGSVSHPNEIVNFIKEI